MKTKRIAGVRIRTVARGFRSERVRMGTALADGTVLERLSEIADSRPKNGCWPWPGSKTEQDYGIVGVIAPDGRRTSTTAARAVWRILKHATLRSEHRLLCICGRHECVNPRHRERV